MKIIAECEKMDQIHILFKSKDRKQRKSPKSPQKEIETTKIQQIINNSS